MLESSSSSNLLCYGNIWALAHASARVRGWSYFSDYVPEVQHDSGGLLKMMDPSVRGMWPGESDGFPRCLPPEFRNLPWETKVMSTSPDPPVTIPSFTEWYSIGQYIDVSILAYCPPAPLRLYS